MTSSPEPLPGTTAAIGFRRGLPIDSPDSLLDVTVPVEPPTGHDLLVEVRAVSVNPVDVKVRASARPTAEPRIIGYDAAGTVRAIGDAVTRFAVGDEVFYAGSIGRPGTDQRLHTVDERIVGHAPTTLSPGDAAALPLTAITAWESLFDRMRLTPDSTGVLLVIGAAGGVGSMIIQLATALTGMTVVAVASRPESAEWARGLGAHHVVGRSFAPEVARLAPDGVDAVFTSFTPGNLDAIASVIRPRGQVVAIDESGGSIDALKAKSVTWHWELMFTRPQHEPEDDYQHRLLERVAALVDAGRIRTTATVSLTPLDAATLREAHRLVESSATVGKVVVSGWPA